MSCNPINFVAFKDTRIISIEEETQAKQGAVENGILLPRTGSAKTYKQQVQVFNAGKTVLYFYMPALYKTKTAYQQIVRTNNKLKPPEKCDEATTVVQDGEPQSFEKTALETFYDNDTVNLKVCFISENCKTHTETPFAAADIQITGYSDGGFTCEYTIDWAEFLSFAGCMREYPLEVTDPTTPIYINIARVNSGSDFGSVHDIYFLGLHNIEDQETWTKAVPHAENIVNKNPEALSQPPFTKPTLNNVKKTQSHPTVPPAGGELISTLCLAGGGGPGPSIPGLSINDITVNENETPATFTVTCNPPATEAFTVQYQTLDGTALAGADYLSTSGTLSFAIGDSTKQITVAIINDNIAEVPEAFTVKLSNLSTTTVTMTKDIGTCNIIDDDSGSGTGSCPVLLIGKPSFKVYKPGEVLDFPPVVGQIGSADNNMEIKIILQNTQGSITPPTAVGSATVVYDDAIKTLTVSGPKNDVNATLVGMKFTPGADDKGDINIIGQITNLDTPGTGGSSGKFVTENPYFPSRAAEAPNIELIGTGGSIVLRVITSDNKLVTDLYTMPVAFTNNLDNTADLIVYAINQTNTSPKFVAEKTALNSFKVTAPMGLGSKANSYHVVVKERTGSLDINGSTAFVGGVTGSGDNKKKNGDIGDWLINAGKGLLAGAIDGVVNEVIFPKDDETAITDIRYYYQGCIVVPVPNVYNEITRTMSGPWDYQTFKYVFTDNPAWCALHHIQDQSWGLGKNLYNLMSSEQKIQLHKDLFEVSLRCDEKIDGKPRYTVNCLLTNKRSKWDQLTDICSVFHGRPIPEPKNVLRIYQDRPKQPKMIVNHTSVTDDGFEYGGEAYNQVSKCLVSWFDPKQHSKLATTGVGVNVGGVINDLDTISVVAFGVADEDQSIRHGRKVIIDNTANPVAVRYTALPDHSHLIPGDIVLICDIWTDTDFPNVQAGRLWPNETSNDLITSLRIDQEFKTANIGKKIYIELDDGSVLESSILSGNEEIININDPIDVNNLTGLNKFNIGDGQPILITEITPKRFDNGMYEVAGIYYDESKFITMDTGIY